MKIRITPFLRNSFIRRTSGVFYIRTMHSPNFHMCLSKNARVVSKTDRSVHMSKVFKDSQGSPFPPKPYSTLEPFALSLKLHPSISAARRHISMRSRKISK